MLKKPALYSLETMRSFGIGGGVRRLRGLSLLYHGFSGTVALDVDPTVRVDLVVAVVKVLSATSFSSVLKEVPSDTTCWRGSVATGSDEFVVSAAPTGSVEEYSFSWRPSCAMLGPVHL